MILSDRLEDGFRILSMIFLHTGQKVVDFNPDTGSLIKGMTWQGYDAESTWTRGQAWALWRIYNGLYCVEALMRYRTLK